MRVVRFLLRFFGWLLTPIVAWAASFLGAWVAAGVFRSTAPMTSLWLTVAAGGLAAAVALLGWLRLLRRSPRLRQTLEVATDGTPVVALEESEPSGK